MTPLSPALKHMLQAGEAAVLVSIIAAEGSTPREAGATMLVAAKRAIGTIGGGQLEFHACDLARQMLETGELAREVSLALGPAMGQCCGGRVKLALKRADQADVAGLDAGEKAEMENRPMVLIFGAGHVGRALAAAMAPLPLRVLLVDDREAELALSAASVEMRLMDDPEMALSDASPGSAALIMTHSHALDYRLAEAALRDPRFAYVGMIGSATKRARFLAGLKRGAPVHTIRFHCPIGGHGVPDKRPEVIAALAAAEVVRAVMSPLPQTLPSSRPERSAGPGSSFATLGEESGIPGLAAVARDDGEDGQAVVVSSCRSEAAA
jgi:xanthine dehydrogenase accessory protein XdhC